MPRIHYLPDAKDVLIGPAETILNASLRAGVPHTHACGGNARCSTCRVLILKGLENCAPRNEKERALAERLHFPPDIRLACQTTVAGDVDLRRLVLDAEDEELTSQIRPGATPVSVGEERHVAVLFADIRGFTAFAERLPPYDVIHALNRYFHQMGQVIHRNGGYIDNYMGDGLMALFGVEDPTDAALRATRAGLEMLEAVERLRSYFQAIYAKCFQIGVGVHCGEVVVGTVGTADRKRETAIGDAVNFASRIEAANKEAGTTLLISEETYARVKGWVRVGRQVRVTLPGKTGEYTLYEVVGMNETGERPASAISD